MRLLLICFLSATLAMAETPHGKYDPCKDIIAACDATVQAQDESIKALKANQKELENKVVDAENEGSVMKYFYLGVGLLAGFGVGYLTVSRH